MNTIPPNIGFCREHADEEEPYTPTFMHGDEKYEVTVERVE